MRPHIKVKYKHVIYEYFSPIISIILIPDQIRQVNLSHFKPKLTSNVKIQESSRVIIALALHWHRIACLSFPALIYLVYNIYNFFNNIIEISFCLVRVRSVPYSYS